MLSRPAPFRPVSALLASFVVPPVDVESLLALNDRSRIAGRHARRRRLLRLSGSGGGGDTGEAALAAVAREIEDSVARCEQRRRERPPVRLDESLPIAARAAEIRQAVLEHPVVVVTGATGSGKSTQLPLILVEAGFGAAGLIGHTQPRRIAARSIAARIAEQLDSPLGRYAGYKIRFADALQESAYIKLMTDGILLAEIQSDRYLEAYEVLIVDEAHERSVNIDLILGLARRLLPRRPEFKVVITSATIDARRWADQFSADCPVIDVEGRSYPVEIRYSAEPLAAAGGDEAVVEAIVGLLNEGPGDLLVFQPTEYEIRSTARRLRQRLAGSAHGATEIVPLYARLPAEQQSEVFTPRGRRRVVIATNVAESSITVPGIRYVVDTGTARISRYAPRSKIQRLPIEPISQASADQRAGRCGRVAPGICLRLYTADDYASRPRFTPPEIRRSNLAGVILQFLSRRLGEIADFPFLDPPTREAVRDGFDTLWELGAIDPQRQLTDLGRTLARMPADPRIARMLLAADEFGCLSEVLVIAAGLEVPDPRLRPLEQQQQADARHAAHDHPQSDFLTLLNVFDFHQRLKQRLSRSQLARALRDQFLSPNHLRQWIDVHRQLQQITAELGLRGGPRRGDESAIHRALLSGLLSGAAQKTDRGDYQGAHGLRFVLWPGSALAERPPKWIVAAELIETSRRFGRTAAQIQPQWIEPLAPHLVEHEYSHPHWSDRAQSCLADERVTLFGLPLVQRAAPYAPIDPEQARDVLIDEGLIGGRCRTRSAFLELNRQRCAEAAAWADRTRDRRWIVDDWTLRRFYRQRLPAAVVDGASLQRWLRAAAEHERALRMHWSDLVPDGGALPSPADYPEALDAGGTRLPLRYRFAPGEPDDGITLDVPLESLGQLDATQLDWLIPGHLAARITELIRMLPKDKRRGLSPAAEVAARVADGLRFGQGVWEQAVASALRSLSAEPIEHAELAAERLPAHLRFNVQVVDAKGKVLDSDRDLIALRQRLGVRPSQPMVASDDPRWTRDRITRWDFDDLPALVAVRRGAIEVAAYPALVDEGDSVRLQLSPASEWAAWQWPRGVARLLALEHRASVRAQVQWLPERTRAEIALAPWIAPERLRDGLGQALLLIAAPEAGPCRTRAAFTRLAAELGPALAVAAQELAPWLRELAAAAEQARRAVEGLPEETSLQTDLTHQLQELFAGQWLRDTPWVWLQQFPRYLKAIALRVDRAPSSAARDRQAMAEIHVHWSRWVEANRAARIPFPIDPQLVEIRWMIEELRVSLFAQTLGTRVPVSARRLERLFERLTRQVVA